MKSRQEEKHIKIVHTILLKKQSYRRTDRVTVPHKCCSREKSHSTGVQFTVENY